MLERNAGEWFGLFCSGLTDERVGCEALEGFEPPGVVVGGSEVIEMRAQRAMLLREHPIARLSQIRRAGITAATVSRLEGEGFTTRHARGL